MEAREETAGVGGGCCDLACTPLSFQLQSRHSPDSRWMAQVQRAQVQVSIGCAWTLVGWGGRQEASHTRLLAGIDTPWGRRAGLSPPPREATGERGRLCLLPTTID